MEKAWADHSSSEDEVVPNLGSAPYDNDDDSSVEHERFELGEPDPEELKSFRKPYTAFIGNLAFSVKEASHLAYEVEQLVSTVLHKKVTAADGRIAIDREVNKPKGFGYIEFDSAEDLWLVLQLRRFSGLSICGRVVSIDKADNLRSNNQREPRRGGGHRDQQHQQHQHHQQHSDQSFPPQRARGEGNLPLPQRGQSNPSYDKIDGSKFRGGLGASNSSNTNSRNNGHNSKPQQNQFTTPIVNTAERRTSRPSLNLAKRTKPLEKVPGRNSSIFGSGRARETAKPAPVPASIPEVAAPPKKEETSVPEKVKILTNPRNTEPPQQTKPIPEPTLSPIAAAQPVSAPPVPTPSVTAPPVTAPSVTTPSVTAPSVTAPSATAPPAPAKTGEKNTTASASANRTRKTTTHTRERRQPGRGKNAGRPTEGGRGRSDGGRGRDGGRGKSVEGGRGKSVEGGRGKSVDGNRGRDGGRGREGGRGRAVEGNRGREGGRGRAVEGARGRGRSGEAGRSRSSDSGRGRGRNAGRGSRTHPSQQQTAPHKPKHPRKKSNADKELTNIAGDKTTTAAPVKKSDPKQKTETPMPRSVIPPAKKEVKVKNSFGSLMWDSDSD